MILFLVIFRIGFDWFVLPDRNANDFGDLCRETSKRVGLEHKSQPLFVEDATLMQITNSFYLTNKRGAIIPDLRGFQKKENLPKNYLLILPNDQGLEAFKVDEIKVRHGKLTYDVVKR